MFLCFQMIDVFNFCDMCPGVPEVFPKGKWGNPWVNLILKKITGLFFTFFFQLFCNFFATFSQLFCNFFATFFATFVQLFCNFCTTFAQLFFNFFATFFCNFFANFFATFFELFSTFNKDRVIGALP